MSDQGGWGGQTPPDYQQQNPQQQSPQGGWGGQTPPAYQQSPHQYQQPGGWPAPGQGQAPPSGQLEEAPSGLISMILGILGLFTIPLVLSIVAIVLGNKAKREAEAQPYRYKNTFGKVGVILGWVGIVLFILGVLLFVLVFAAAFSTGEFTVE